MLELLTRRRLGTKLLLLILPVVVLTTVMALGLLVFAEVRQAEKLNHDAATRIGLRDAHLLTRPLWDLDVTTLRSMMESLVGDGKVKCIRLREEGKDEPSIEYGDCTPFAKGVWVNTPVDFESGSGSRIRIGELTHLVDISADFDELLREISLRLLLVTLLVVVLIICIGMGIRMTILVPLARVSASLRHFEATGKRLPVVWSTEDELGRLIAEYNRSLERQERAEVEILAAKESAEKALEELRTAQQSLIQSEKLASLGSLVAGIAHEINTPVGCSLTVATTLTERARELQSMLDAGSLKKRELTAFIASIEEAGQLLVNSLTMAAHQVQNFKQVAVDQTSSQRRPFNLKTVAEEVLSTLRPRIKHTSYRLEVDIPDDIMMDSYPGPLGQVITNCFTNAVTHGFEGLEAGLIRIEARATDADQVCLDISDDGRGIEAEHLGRIFDPFFTTRMGRGGSGLGLNLVYTIVTGMLGGTIAVDSAPGSGTRMRFSLPRVAPADSRITQR